MQACVCCVRVYVYTRVCVDACVCGACVCASARACPCARGVLVCASMRTSCEVRVCVRAVTLLCYEQAGVQLDD